MTAYDIAGLERHEHTEDAASFLYQRVQSLTPRMQINIYGANLHFMDHSVQARMQQEQQRLRAEQAARQATEIAARQKAAEMEAARQAIAAKVPPREDTPCTAHQTPTSVLKVRLAVITALPEHLADQIQPDALRRRCHPQVR